MSARLKSSLYYMNIPQGLSLLYELYDTIYKDAFFICGIIQFEPKAGLAPVENTSAHYDLTFLCHIHRMEITKRYFGVDKEIKSHDKSILNWQLTFVLD